MRIFLAFLAAVFGAGLTWFLLERFSQKRGDSVENVRSFKARMFKDESGHFRFRIVATNGEPVAQSEGYSRKIDARTIAVALVGEENVEEVEE